MTSSPEELRKAALASSRLALQAKDPKHRARLLAFAADIERQAMEAEQAHSGEDATRLPDVRLAETRAVPLKRRWIRRRRKST